MKKTMMAVLMALVFSLGCTSQQSEAAPKLEKWQEADIVKSIIQRTESRYAKQGARVTDRDDIEFCYKKTAYTLDGITAVHTYFGYLPLTIQGQGSSSIIVKRRVYFWVLYEENLHDDPRFDRKKGDVRKKNGDFYTALWDSGVKSGEEELKYRDQEKRSIDKMMEALSPAKRQ